MIENRKTPFRVVQCLFLLRARSLTLRAAMRTDFTRDSGDRSDRAGPGWP
jgi:hypothetical protein